MNLDIPNLTALGEPVRRQAPGRPAKARGGW